MKIWLPLFTMVLLLCSGCTAGTQEASPQNTSSPTATQVPLTSPAAETTTELPSSSPLPQDPEDSAILTTPPELNVVYMDNVMKVSGWNWEWTAENKDGTMRTTYPDYGTSDPLDWIDSMDTIVKSEGDSIALTFVAEPDNITVYAEPAASDRGTNVALNGKNIVSLINGEGNVVYTVRAEWSSTQGYYGYSYYAFYVVDKE